MDCVKQKLRSTLGVLAFATMVPRQLRASVKVRGTKPLASLGFALAHDFPCYPRKLS
jgi:hypothetical protein